MPVNQVLHSRYEKHRNRIDKHLGMLKTGVHVRFECIHTYMYMYMYIHLHACVSVILTYIESIPTL